MPVTLTFNSSTIDFAAKSMAVGEGQMLLSPAVDFSAAGLDYLDISVKVKGKARPDFVKLSWTGQSRMFSPDNYLWAKFSDSNGELRTRVQVSEHKKWLQSQQITRLAVTLSPNAQYQVESLRVSGGKQVNVPSLSAGAPADAKSGGMILDQLGLAHPHKKIGFLQYDATNIANADHVVFQISKADCWFEQTSDSFRSTDRADAQTEINRTEKALKGDKIVFDSALLKAPGFYEVRVGAEDKDGHLLGTYSDPLNFHVDERDIHAPE